MEVDFLHRINRKIDEFCRAHPGFGIPNLMKIIVIGTALVYVLYMLTGYNASAISFLSFDLAHLLRGEPLTALGEEGINGLMISNAMHLSSWTGKTVTLPIDEDLFLEELNKRRATSRLKTGASVTLDTEGTY